MPPTCPTGTETRRIWRSGEADANTETQRTAMNNTRTLGTICSNSLTRTNTLQGRARHETDSETDGSVRPCRASAARVLRGRRKRRGNRDCGTDNRTAYRNQRADRRLLASAGREGNSRGVFGAFLCNRGGAIGKSHRYGGGDGGGQHRKAHGGQGNRQHAGGNPARACGLRRKQTGI